MKPRFWHRELTRSLASPPQARSRCVCACGPLIKVSGRFRSRTTSCCWTGQGGSSAQLRAGRFPIIWPRSWRDWRSIFGTGWKPDVATVDCSERRPGNRGHSSMQRRDFAALVPGQGGGGANRFFLDYGFDGQTLTQISIVLPPGTCGRLVCAKRWPAPIREVDAFKFALGLPSGGSKVIPPITRWLPRRNRPRL
jgi:hypothetical protein